MKQFSCHFGRGEDLENKNITGGYTAEAIDRI